MRIFIRHAILVGTLVPLVTVPTHAQVRFERPDTSPDYARYRYRDECDAAIRRLTFRIESKSELYADTARLDRTLPLRPYPAEALAAGQVCMQKVNVDTVALSNAYAVAASLLAVGRDADVQRLYDRVYAAATPEDRPRERERMMQVYHTARPMRLASMKALYERAQSEPWDTAKGIMIKLGVAVSNAAFICGDTAYARRIGLPVLERIYQLSPDDPNNPGLKLGWKSNTKLVWDVYRLSLRLTESERLDSIARGKASYKRYLKDLLLKLNGQSYEINHDGDTLPIATLSGDFMFRTISRNDAGNVQHHGAAYTQVSRNQWSPVPRVGRVNLIAVVDMSCYRGDNIKDNHLSVLWPSGVSRCAFLAAVLRRMKETFPAVEITLLAQTRGYFANSAPLTPEQEADTLAQYFLGHYRIPATLLVEKTAFFRITNPTLDQRRIDQPTPNTGRLAFFGRAFLTEPSTLIAVDEDGVIFDFMNGGSPLPLKEPELALEHEIRAVLSRKKSQ